MSPRKKFLWDRQIFETMFSIGITNSTFSAKLAHPLHRIVLEMCLLCSNQERGAKATVDFFFVNIFSEIRVPNVSEKFLKVWFALGTEEKNSRSFGPPISQKIWKKKNDHSEFVNLTAQIGVFGWCQEKFQLDQRLQWQKCRRCRRKSIILLFDFLWDFRNFCHRKL